MKFKTFNHSIVFLWQKNIIKLLYIFKKRKYKNVVFTFIDLPTILSAEGLNWEYAVPTKMLDYLFNQVCTDKSVAGSDARLYSYMYITLSLTINLYSIKTVYQRKNTFFHIENKSIFSIYFYQMLFSENV